MKFTALTLAAVFATVSVFAENPLGFREYQQKFTLSFPSEQDAQKAELKAKPLPADYKLAYSSRWDDSEPKHLDTHEVMVRNNIKGTFFLGDLNWLNGVLNKNPDYIKKLMEGGNSIGLHTLTHPFLTAKNPYEQFREYMRDRIELEVKSQSPVNSQVLPFCNWWAPEPFIPLSIGWAMRATGVISSPDVMYPNRENELGYPAKSFAQSRFVAPGDRNPDLAKFNREMKWALGNEKALAIQPSVSMAMHSWHTPEGLINLDCAYAMVANNPEWWYCNQNEYGAYRYETQNTAIAKKVDGKNAEFTVTRMEPFELGASVPLWFSVNGAKAVSANGAKLVNGSVELPHADGRKLPDVYACADKNGKSRIPFVSLVFTHPEEKVWKAELKTLDGKPVEQLAFSFRFPSQWSKEVIRKDLGSQNSVSVTVAQEAKKNDLYYRYGKPYYALQADFMRDGKRYRLYADIREDEEKNLPVTASAAAQVYICPENPDLSGISMPGADPANFNLVAGKLRKVGDVGTGVVHPGMFAGPEWKDKQALMIVEFKPIRKGRLTLVASPNAKRGEEIWLNGHKFEFDKDRKAEFTPLEGVNRFVIKNSGPLAFLILNGEKEQNVEFLPKK